MSPTPTANPLVQTSVGAALLGGVALAAFGVGSAFWAGLEAQQIEAFIGLGAIGAVLLASECAAVALAWALTRDGLRNDAVTWLRGGVFAACTAANVLAGHFGAEALNTRLVAPQRAPYEAAVNSSAALLELAQNTKADTQSRHASELAGLERTFEAERAANPLYVTARGRQQEEQRTGLSQRHAAEMREAQAAISAATDQLATARANLAEAPQGFTPTQMWGFAALLELLKGVLVALAAPRRRRINPEGAALSIDPAAYAAMDEAELAEIESRASAAKALAQHARRRLAKRSA
jgi:hypothetical protein